MLRTLPRRAFHGGRRLRMRPVEDQDVSGLPPPPPPRPPTFRQLRDLFFHAAAPMVGFGFMDNTVMILAGDAIDSSIGVRFGLATMTAAALGQVCSDVSGVAFGGVVEWVCTKMGLPVPNMTGAQQRMRISKTVAMGGSIVGVVIGCLLGMVNLFSLDLDAAEMAKRQRELNRIFKMVITEAHKVLHAERASLFIYDRKRGELWSHCGDGDGDGDGGGGESGLVRVSAQHSLLGAAAATGEIVNIEDVAEDGRFSALEVDLRSGFQTRNLLICPVFSGGARAAGDGTAAGEGGGEGEGPAGAGGNGADGPGRRVIAVLEVANKEDGSFTKEDERVIRMLARHVEIFLTEIATDEDSLNLDGVAFVDIH